MAKVKLKVVILHKHCHLSSAFIYKPNLILLHINMLYDYILDKFEFECPRVRVKFTAAVL